MITDNDIRKLKKEFKKDFATKTELNLLRQDLNNFKKSVDIRFTVVEDAIDNLSRDLADFREQTTKSLDWLVGAFKKFDEEHTILSMR
ncbi:MAG: hypothetical protein WEC80_00500 [Patescibacteria group bacterium]